MRRTVVLVLGLAFIVGSTFIDADQKKVVEGKQLEGLLPGAPAGFKVDQPATSSIESTDFGRLARAEQCRAVAVHDAGQRRATGAQLPAPGSAGPELMPRPFASSPLLLRTQGRCAGHAAGLCGRIPQRQCH